MLPALSAKMDTSRVEAAALDFAAVLGREVNDDAPRHLRTLMRAVVDVTPPNQGAGRSGADGFRTGRFKIARQMRAVFIPVKLKGHRDITHVFGRELRRPVRVPTVEKYPDVAALYRANSRVLTNRIGYRITPGKKFYVDRAKFAALLQAKQARVGILASGWLRGFYILDLTAPAWIARHGAGRGEATLVITETYFHFYVANDAVPDSVQADLERRVQYALGYTANNIERQVRAIAEKNAARFNRSR